MPGRRIPFIKTNRFYRGIALFFYKLGFFFVIEALPIVFIEALDEDMIRKSYFVSDVRL